MEPERRIKKAIISLQTHSPFFAFLSMQFKIKEMPKHWPMNTMGVDADWNLYYSKEFVEEVVKSQDVLIGCVCHEDLHIALNHIGRLGNRLKNIANIAQDMVVWMICDINGLSILRGREYVNVDKDYDTGWMDMDPFGMKRILIKSVSEKSWERIYEEIVKQIEKQGKSPGDINDQISGSSTKYVFDEHLHDEFKKLSKEKQQELIEKSKQVISDAYTYAKQQGKVPGAMNRYIKELLEPKIPWQSKLMKYVKESVDPKDWTYRRPHRKSYNLGIYMPSIKKEGVDVEVVIDTSGSIDIESYTEFVSELYGIMNVLQNSRIYITFIDDEVQDEYELKGIEKDKLLSIKPKGFGGTDMEAGLDHIKSKNRNNPITIVLTDGYTDCNGRAIDYPFEVLWVICKNGLESKKAEKHFKYGSILCMEDL